jgi:hypothetical protein
MWANNYPPSRISKCSAWPCESRRPIVPNCHPVPNCNPFPNCHTFQNCHPLVKQPKTNYYKKLPDVANYPPSRISKCSASPCESRRPIVPNCHPVPQLPPGPQTVTRSQTGASKQPQTNLLPDQCGPTTILYHASQNARHDPANPVVPSSQTATRSPNCHPVPKLAPPR